jgi:hypothetical protein
MDYISSNRDGANRALRSRILIGAPLVPFRLGLVSPIARRGVQFEVRRAELSILDIDMEMPYSSFAKKQNSIWRVCQTLSFRIFIDALR